MNYLNFKSHDRNLFFVPLLIKVLIFFQFAMLSVAYDERYDLFDDPSASTPSSSGNSSHDSPLSEGMTCY
jgi:hypothetical protein